MLISSPVHFISTYVILPILLCFLLPCSLSPSYPFLAIFLTFSPVLHPLFSFLSSFVLPFLLQISFLSSPPLCLLLLALLLILSASSFSLPSGVNGRGICRLLSFLVKRLRSTEQHQHNYYQSDFIRIHQLRAFLSRSDHSIHFIAELACLCSF